MKLSRLAAESAAILARLRKNAPNADAECLYYLADDEEHKVSKLQLFQSKVDGKWYLAINEVESND